MEDAERERQRKLTSTSRVRKKLNKKIAADDADYADVEAVNLGPIK